jgi:hypothetical protein
VGLRARDFPTERVLSRTPLIIRTVDIILASRGGKRVDQNNFQKTALGAFSSAVKL